MLNENAARRETAPRISGAAAPWAGRAAECRTIWQAVQSNPFSTASCGAGLALRTAIERGTEVPSVSWQ